MSAGGSVLDASEHPGRCAAPVLPRTLPPPARRPRTNAVRRGSLPITGSSTPHGTFPLLAPLLAAFLTPEPSASDVRPSPTVAAFEFGADGDVDFDRRPDGWTRRRGPGFPHFLTAEIDRAVDAAGSEDADRGSLRFDAETGAAAYYSPPVPIDDRHAYLVRGRMRAAGLTGHGAVLSVSLLDAGRTRLLRRLSRYVTGDGGGDGGWVDVSVGPLPPTRGVRWVVLGCHLVPGDTPSVSGSAWFDGLTLGLLPHLAVEVADGPHVRPAGSSATVRVTVGGTDGRDAGTVRLVLTDDRGMVRFESRPPLVADPAADVRTARVAVPLDEPGLHTLRAELPFGGGRPLVRTTTLAAFTDVPLPESRRFGWTLGGVPAGIAAGRLADLAAAGAVGWLRLPVDAAAGGGTRTRAVVGPLRRAGVTVVPVLTAGTFGGDPADPIARPARDADDAGRRAVAERVSVAVGPGSLHWQFGRDGDASLAADPAAADPLLAAFTRLVPGGTAVLPGDAAGRGVPLTPGTAGGPSDGTRGSGWRFLSPEDAPGDLLWAAANAAAAGGPGADGAVFSAPLFAGRGGLFSPDGAPTARFPAWRTAAAALADARFLGRPRLPGGGAFVAFDSPRGAVLVGRRADAGVSSLTLGGGPVRRTADGRARPLARDGGGRHLLPLEPAACVVTGANADLLRFRLGVRVVQELLESRRASQPLTVSVDNPLPQNIAVRVAPDVPAGWSVEPGGRRLDLPPGGTAEAEFRVTLPPDVGLGRYELPLRCELSADRTYRLAVPRDLPVRLAGLRVSLVERPLPGGGREVTQTVVNELSPPQTLALRCDLFLPGRPRATRLIPRLAPGVHRATFVLGPSADRLDPDAAPDPPPPDGTRAWLRSAEIGGDRVLNLRWNLGEPPPPG